jgi:hypothetical protein
MGAVACLLFSKVNASRSTPQETKKSRPEGRLEEASWEAGPEWEDDPDPQRSGVYDAIR